MKTFNHEEESTNEKKSTKYLHISEEDLMAYRRALDQILIRYLIDQGLSEQTARTFVNGDN